VRAAFSTGDRLTIRDTAGELWARISDADAVFLVTDPQGRVIASLGGEPSQAIEGDLPFVSAARARFPEQASGFVFFNDRLYQVTVTPVYVQSGSEPVLIDVVVAGYLVDKQLAEQLKRATGGSEFIFIAGDRALASTMSNAHTEEFTKAARSGHNPPDYAPLRTELRDLTGARVAELWILRSFESARRAIATLRRNIFLVYLAALAVGLLLTAVLARRILEPIRELDRAAAEVSQQNYDNRVNIDREDELGRLGATFNSMCASIQSAREDLIRQERINTIGQLSTSIVHDLRNPLAAIYGGAEMLVDGDLPDAQVKRLAGNIYRASRNIQDMLQELADVSRGRPDRTEPCRLRDVVAAAYEPVRALAETSKVDVRIAVPEEIEVPLARARMERVFSNLLVNSLEAMKEGGQIDVTAQQDNGSVLIDISDNVPGISDELRRLLFLTFVTVGMRYVFGLGLALSRQTVLNHGGDLWLVADTGRGAHFRMKLANS
jgi:signal transduction histidine kinase